MEDIDLSSIMVGSGEAPVAAEPEIKPEIKTAAAQQTIENPTVDSASTEHSQLVTRIKLLFDTFPAKLKEIKPKKPIDKLSDEQLLELNNNINYQLGARTNVEAMAKTVPLLLKAVEELAAQFTPLRIQGTHQVCFEPDVQDMIKYSIIDSGLTGISSTPQQRLAFTLISAAMRQHAMNSAIESLTPEQKQAMARAMNPAQKQEPPAPKPEPNDKYVGL